MRQNCSFVKGRFTGDPSYEYEHTETKRGEERDPDADPDDETTVRKYEHPTETLGHDEEYVVYILDNMVY